MKIAVVVRSLKVGGMERVAISLTKAFQEEGHEAHLIYFKHKKKHFSTDDIKNKHFFNFELFLAKSVIGIFYEIFIRILNVFFRKSYPITKGFVTSLIFKHKIKQLEKEKKFDLIIIRGQGTFEFLWFKQDNRYVQVCENILYPNRNFNTMQKLFIKLLYKNKNIVCVSNGVLISFENLTKNINFKAKKLIKITNPIDIQTINMLSQKYKPNIDTPYIVNVGRLDPVKQIPLLIDAYAYIKSKYNIAYKLVLVGQGSDEKIIHEQINNLKLNKDVLMVGVQTNPYPWILHAKLFVLSSKHEGLGMVILEALACETSLVVTNSMGGVQDIMQDELKQFLCEQTIESLGEKIYDTIQNKPDIDFHKHLSPFLPKTIISKYIKEFISKDI